MPDLKFTQEVVEALRGLAPFTQNGTINVVPEPIENSKLPDDFKTSFEQRSYTQKEKARIVQDSVKKGGMTPREMIEWARVSIKGWEKMYDLANQTEIKFEANGDGAPLKELWELVPDVLAFNLYKHATIISGLNYDEKRGLVS